MSDPDPSDTVPQRRRRTFFGLGRRPDASAHAPEGSNGTTEISAPATPQAMRLRIQEFQELRVDDVMVARAEVRAVLTPRQQAELERLRSGPGG